MVNARLPAMLVAVIMYSADSASCNGAPDIVPFIVDIVKPAGRAGLTAQLLAAPPDSNGKLAVIGIPAK